MNFKIKKIIFWFVKKIINSNIEGKNLSIIIELIIFSQQSIILGSILMGCQASKPRFTDRKTTSPGFLITWAVTGVKKFWVF